MHLAPRPLSTNHTVCFMRSASLLSWVLSRVGAADLHPVCSVWFSFFYPFRLTCNFHFFNTHHWPKQLFLCGS